MVTALKLEAQQEMMLNSLPDLWHSTTVNPAYFPKDKHFVIGLPGYSLDAAHTGSLTYNDIFIKDGDRTLLNFSKAIGALDPQNEVFFEQRIETVSLGLALGKWRLQAGHANRFSGVLNYPKSLPELIWNGNAPYIGQVVDVALQAKLFNWNEWSAGLSREFGRLTIGARLKYLSGTSALKTDDDHHLATIYTNPDIYQLEMETDYGFHSSAIVSAFDTSGLGFDLQLAKVKGKPFSSNSGIAFDLGLQLRVTDRLSLSASLLDWGGTIKWKENANYFRSQGKYNYEGVSFPGGDILNSGDSLDFESKLDTLNDIFNFKKTPEEFSTRLPERAYLSGSFALTEKWTLSVGYFYMKKADRQATSAVSASVRWQPVRWLSLGGMYSLNERSAANLGFHLALKPGPVQVYFASDNLLNAFSIKSSPAVNLRAGVAVLL